MTRVAGIDCGTNSLRLLIADVKGNRMRALARRSTITRLGRGVDQTGRFDDSALALSIGVVAEYARLCRARRVERIRFVATSATRDAANRDVFLTAVGGLLGIEPEVISGREEAELSFMGATESLRRIQGPRVVVDLGGGSTEIASGVSQPEASYSMNIGSVRMTERWMRSDPPTGSERAAAQENVREALDVAVAAVPVGQAKHLIGVSGTVTTVTAHALRLPKKRASAIHGASLPVELILEAANDLAGMTHAELAALPYMKAGRVEVAAAGALIWIETIERVRREMAANGTELTNVVTSMHDILDGVARSAVSPQNSVKSGAARP